MYLKIQGTQVKFSSSVNKLKLSDKIINKLNNIKILTNFIKITIIKIQNKWIKLNKCLILQINSQINELF